MKIVYLVVSLFIFHSVCFAEIKLSKDVFRIVPFSSQYSEDGALIRSVDFRSVNDLIPQIEKKFSNLLKNKKLSDRNEAHITVITPPEGQTGFFPNSIGIDQVITNSELIAKYKNQLQETKFDIECLGMQRNKKGNIVFYLVVKSPDILKIRTEIANIVRQSDLQLTFEPIKNYYPHITVGYVGGDVHGVSKGKETCVANIEIR